MGFLQDILEKILHEAVEAWVGLFVNLGDTVFYVENGIASVLSSDRISQLYTFISSFAISLILLKMLKKGFWTYILWRDGDPDAPIQQTVTNLILAVSAVLCFPIMYDWYAQVSLWLIHGVLGLSVTIGDVTLWVVALTSILGFGIIWIISALIYLLMLFILYLQFIKRSVELLALRLGFPLACAGLLDSDNGVFATTVKTFIQASLTTVAQLFFMQLSISTFLNMNDNMFSLFYCIAFCSAAFGVPRTLQFIMLPQGGGGGIQKVTGALHAASMVRSFLPR